MRTKSIDKRSALLDATLKLVNDHGFHDAPMSKIAKLAKVSPATIYLYFEHKQDLINQLYIEVKASFSDYAFKNYDEEMPVKQGFKTIWYNIADFKLNLSEEAYFLTQCDNTPMIDAKSREEGLIHLQPLLTLWERGQDEGIIKPMSAYLLYAYTIYPMAFLMSVQKRDEFQLSKEALSDAFQAAWDSIKV